MRTNTIELLICTTTVILLATAHSAHAVYIRNFFSWGDEQIIKVAEFPHTEAFKTPDSKTHVGLPPSLMAPYNPPFSEIHDGRHFDPGYRYKQMRILFVPIWNYDEQWCGYVGDSRQYLNISKDKLDALASEAGINLPATPSLTFWETCGGKIVFLVVIALYVKRASRRMSAV